MDLVNYEAVPNDYGQIRFFPLRLANQTNTLLEEWFTNYKFLYFCTSRDVEKEFSQHHLTVEFSYILREKIRAFKEIRSDVNVLIDRSLFQDLFRILVSTLEKANELYEIAIAKKVGNSVFDLREEIEKKTRKFHRAPFPEKIEKFEVKENFKRFLETLNAVNKARNCYEHRNGILGKEDCNSGQTLILNFRFPAPVSTGGKRIGILDSMPIGEKFPIQFVDERKTFRVNQKLDMSFNDSYKLLYTINFALKGIIDHIYECCDMDEQVRILKQFKCS
jgi:hypothetical protein